VTFPCITHLNFEGYWQIVPQKYYSHLYTHHQELPQILFTRIINLYQTKSENDTLFVNVHYILFLLRLNIFSSIYWPFIVLLKLVSKEKTK
jgi:hypothetical protein